MLPRVDAQYHREFLQLGALLPILWEYQGYNKGLAIAQEAAWRAAATAARAAHFIRLFHRLGFCRYVLACFVAATNQTRTW